MSAIRLSKLHVSGPASSRPDGNGPAFVTGNPNKLLETKYILSQGTPIEIDAADLDIPELQGTTREIASAKCRRAAEFAWRVLSILVVYLHAYLSEGLNNLLVGFPTKEAYALCTFAYSAGPGTEPILFEGRTDGTIVPPRGPGTFGWDAIFQPDGFDKT
ncbi:hypothetical protein ID866_4757 [Astraeus odoratus]|nr:hypothetical protein ID866_4757 [Astraeus odoratus]